MRRMNIQYNGHTPEDFNFNLATRPVIEPSEQTRDRFQINGRLGELIGKDETRGNARLTFTLHRKANSNTLTSRLKEVMAWLRNIGEGRLEFLDPYSPEGERFEVLNTPVVRILNMANDYIRLEVEMEVYPFKFSRVQNTYDIGRNTSQTIELTTDTCEPLYSTYGAGYFEVNGNRFTVTASDTIWIDVRRQISYHWSGGASAESEVSGDYKKLVLKNGNNTLTSNGLELRILDTREGYIL